MKNKCQHCSDNSETSKHAHKIKLAKMYGNLSEMSRRSL